MFNTDLHIHTTCSDGLLTPVEAVRFAAGEGLGAMAITDHDSVSGVENALREGEKAGIEVVAGVELSAYAGERCFHILGLFIDWKSGWLEEHLGFFRVQRYLRAEKIVAILNKLKVNIDMEDVLAVSGDGAVGRPHVAQALVNVGAVKRFDEAFKRYLGKGRPACVPKHKITPSEAADIIHRSNGAAIMAHPGVSARNEAEIREVMGRGMDGLEVSHPKHSAGQEARFRWMARREEWLIGGGSDSHGPGRDVNTKIGNCSLKKGELEKIRAFSEKNAEF